MSVILILILASLATALLFLGGFIWAVRSGQFDDTLTPSMRVLTDEPTRPANPTVGAPAAADNQSNAGVNAASAPVLQKIETDRTGKPGKKSDQHENAN